MKLVIIASIVGSAIVSAITTKILATRYFEIVDGYVDEICEITKKFVDDVKAMVNKHE